MLFIRIIRKFPISVKTQINYDYREQPIIPVHDSQGNWAGSNGPELGNAENPVADQERTKNNHGQ